ncbi:transcriptional regulator [Photobacterium sanctipauli]|uniref:Transcriptional regulator n=1 Tax=Photobacterium sanctipauli TaxID=1342794 RepID=A0A2T3NVD7_9GAMM|nr:transcriptional regulator [Photobacterium sanctipauli]PSW20188.1 transcriptional regulator [Photobacterium sanctipauli]
MFHYDTCGLDYIYLKNGYEVEVEDGEEFVSFHDFDGIQEAIGLSIVNQKRWMTKEQLKFIRGEFNLSQTKFGSMLFVDRQTIARWEKGEVAIPPMMDINIRLLYLESIDKESNISMMVEYLADAEASDIMEKVILEEVGDHWEYSKLA